MGGITHKRRREYNTSHGIVFRIASRSCQKVFNIGIVISKILHFFCFRKRALLSTFSVVQLSYILMINSGCSIMRKMKSLELIYFQTCKCMGVIKFLWEFEIIGESILFGGLFLPPFVRWLYWLVRSVCRLVRSLCWLFSVREWILKRVFDQWMSSR